MQNEPKLVAELVVPAADGSTLTELAEKLSGEDIAFGPQREVGADSNLYFDLSGVVETAKAVTAIIGGIGGTAKLIEYLITLLRRSPQRRIVVKVGSTIVTVTGNNEAEIRSALETIFRK
jgi:hypothetical protein